MFSNWDKLFCEVAIDLGFIDENRAKEASELQERDSSNESAKRIDAYLIELDYLDCDRARQVAKMVDRLDAASVDQGAPNVNSSNSDKGDLSVSSDAANIIECRENALWYKNKWYLVALIGISVVVVLCFLLSSFVDSPEVRLVKSGSLQICPNVTINDMVDNFMGSPSWEAIETEKGEKYVNVSGDISYCDKKVRATIQFAVDLKKKTFEFYALEFNGVPQSNFIAMGLLYKMVESSKGESGGHGVGARAVAPEAVPANVPDSAPNVSVDEEQGQGEGSVQDVNSGSAAVSDVYSEDAVSSNQADRTENLNDQNDNSDQSSEFYTPQDN